MKKLILIITTVICSLLHVNATNKNHIAQVFDWEVTTNKGYYSGTSLSLKKAEYMLSLSSKNEIIRSKKITSYLILKSDLNKKRNYFWEVKTNTGYAKGYTSKEAYAHKMIALVASGDAIVSKIIISQPQE